MPTWTLYDIQPPTDPQINGYGLYRTVVGGVLLNQISRVQVPDNPLWSTTFPWESANLDNETLIYVWPMAGRNTITTGGGTTTASKGNSVSISQVFDSENFEGTSSDDPLGMRGTHRWELTLGYVRVQSRYTWSYSTTTLDSTLGAAMTLDNDLPPFASKLAVWEEHMWLAGNPTNPHFLYYSKRFLPEAVPALNFLEIGTPVDPIIAIAPIAGVLGVFTLATKYRITGNVLSGFNATEGISRRGCHAVGSLVITDQGIIFLSHDGIFVTNFISPDKNIGADILPLLLGKTVNGNAPLNWNAASTISACFYKNQYFLSYPDGINTQPNKVAIYSFDTHKWRFYDYVCRSLYVEEDLDKLISGSTDGFVYVLEDGQQDAGQNINLDVETKDYHGGSPHVRSLFLYSKIDADTKGDPLTVQYYIDNILKHTATVNGARNKMLIPLPEDVWGHQWRMRFQYTGPNRIEIYGAAMMKMPLEMA